MISINLATQKDLQSCARILMDNYNSSVLNEGWTIKTATKLCNFFYKMQPDLFFVAKDGDKVVGFTFSYIKPWAKGEVLMIEELSVDKRYRKQQIATNLLLNLVTIAKKNYKVVSVNGTTYIDKNGMPYSWYDKINFKKVDELFVIEIGASELIKNLKNNAKLKKH